ncbi:MAG: galactose oxidase-like domain-containing protein [Meiothermus sp.]|nr:galactose oxidase-like domain-containing protein [Meiothermus sp.]
MNQWNKWMFGLALAVLIAACDTGGSQPVSVQITNFTDNVDTSAAQASVTLSWNALAGVSSYAVERKTGAADFSPIATVNTNTYTDSAVDFSTTYVYRVIGGTARSPERQVVVGARSGGPGPGPGPGPVAPGVPQNVLAYAVSSGSGVGVRVVWQAPATGENITYTVQRRLGSGNFSTLSANLTDLEFTDTTSTLAGGRTYTYRVQAVNSAGSSNFINTNDVAVPAECAPRVGNEASNAGVRGCFGPVVDNWPLVPTYSALLPDGRVIAWYASDDVGKYREDTSTAIHNTSPRSVAGLGAEDGSFVQIWNPAVGTFSDASFGNRASQGSQSSSPSARGTDLFCAGYTVLTNGEFFTAGGNMGSEWGSIKLNVFNPRTNTWENGPNSRTPNMWRDRWYPTVTKLPNGELLITGGKARPDTSFVDGSNPTETSAGDSSRQGQPICRIGGGNCPTGLQGGGGAYGIANGANNAFEVYNPATGQLRMLGVTAAPTAAGFDFSHYYPWWHVAPNGSVFLSGASYAKGALSTSGNGSWAYQSTSAQTSGFGYRWYGSSVMYEPGKILVLGGGTAFIDNGVPGGADNNTNTTLHITLPQTSSVTPAMVTGPNMAYRRTHASAVSLANGEVFVSGGQQRFGESGNLPQTYTNMVSPSTLWNIDLAVRTSEIWTPNATSGSFRLGAKAAQPRMYHSVAMLLPDATVWTAAGGGCGFCNGSDEYGSLQSASPTQRANAVNQKNHEIYYPPYLFTNTGALATRPVIQSTNIPLVDNYPTLAYNSAFSLTWAHPTAGRSIRKVTFVALGAPTHGFDQNQRYLELPIQSQSGNTLTVQTPSDGMYGSAGTNSARNVAPPGFYMVFILDNAGVPSTAQIVRIQ